MLRNIINMKLKLFILSSLVVSTCMVAFFKRATKLVNNDELCKPNKELFKPVNFSYSTQQLIIPEGFTYSILFSEGDEVITYQNKKTPAKGKHDFVGFIPTANNGKRGWLYVGHETRNIDAVLGDGGGGTIMQIEFKNNQWKVIGDKKAINFSEVGGTVLNCGGTITPTKMILSAEEMMPLSNDKLSYHGIPFSDLSDYNGRPRYENYGWMVMIDPNNAKATTKIKNFGRYVHEDAHCTKDGKTIYLTDDYSPGCFFKFVCEEPNNYDKGQLYAYKQNQNGVGGEWLAIPMNDESLRDARGVAIKLGATMFARQEWVDEANGKIYITETGTDTINVSKYLSSGANVPTYMNKYKISEGKYAYPYGAVLEFDPNTNSMTQFIEGGALSDGGHFSNPDGLHIATINSKTYLIINEDLIGNSQGRVSIEAERKGEYYNDIYFFDLAQIPDRNNLKRFAVGPRGCETTGSWWNAKTKTYFFSVHDPSPANPSPFNKSFTVAVQGF